MEKKRKMEKENGPEKNTNDIKIKFNEYAMKKYECSELKLNEFYKKYDKAIAYYENKNKKRNIVNTISLIGLGAGVPTFALTFILSTGSYIPLGIVTLGMGVFSIMNSCTIPEKEEYSLQKTNPYIEKGTTFDKMAHEYCKMKKLAKKKA